MKRRHPQLLRQALTAIVLAAIIVGSSGFSALRHAPQARPDTRLHSTPHVLDFVSYNSSNWPDMFDPANVTDGPAIQVIYMLYANLVKLDSQNRVVPDLASSWSVDPSGTVYTFHLRPDAHFSDGKPITADDVLYSYKRELDPKALDGKGPSPVAVAYMGHVVGAADYNAGKTKVLKGVKVVDPHTVQITIDKPIAFFLQTLSYWSNDIVEKGTPIGALTTQNPMQHQVSSGPFYISKFSYKNSLTLVPNKGYYGYKKMKLHQVNFTFISDQATMYQGYESGQYSMTIVPSNRLIAARSMPDFHSSPILAIDYIIFNMAKPPFNNKALRLAASYAIDRDAINKSVLHGGQKTIYSVVPQGIPGYDAAGKSFAPSYNPAKARMYLATAKKQLGSKFPSSLTIKYYAGNTGLAHEYTELQYEWKQIGLNVKVEGVPLNIWLGLVTKPTPSLTFTGGDPWVQAEWGDDYPDPQDFTTVILGPTAQYNVGNYANPQFDALIDKALTAKGSERAQLYVKAGRIALNDGAWAMIGQVVNSFRWRSNITGMAVWSSNNGQPMALNDDWTNVDVH